MKITDLISTASIDLNVKAKNKEELIEKAVKLMTKNGNIKDEQKYLELVTQREKQSSTGIGEGIAIPHGKGECITKPGLAAMVIPNGADFDALDGNKVNLLFLIAAPDTKDNIHLDVLSRLSTLLMDASFRENLLNAKSKDEFLKIIDNAGKELTSNDNVRTGSKIRIELTTETKEYTVVVLGDVTGTGKITMADVMKTANYLLDNSVIKEGCYKKAADVTKDGNIKISDVMKLANYVLNGKF